MSLVRWEGYFRYIPAESWNHTLLAPNGVALFNRLLNTYHLVMPVFGDVAVPTRLIVFGESYTY